MTNLCKLVLSQQQTVVVWPSSCNGNSNIWGHSDFVLTLLPSFVGATLLEPGMHEFLFLD